MAPGDVPAAGAILDRFLQHAQVIATPGRSLRLKDKAQTEATEPPTQQENTKPKKDN